MIRDKLEFPRVITNSIMKYTLLAIRCQVGKNDERKNILNKKKKGFVEGLEKNKKQNYNNTNRIILFHFSNTDYIFTAICYVHRNVRMRANEEEAEKPGV